MRVVTAAAALAVTTVLRTANLVAEVAVLVVPRTAVRVCIPAALMKETGTLKISDFGDSMTGRVVLIGLALAESFAIHFSRSIEIPRNWWNEVRRGEKWDMLRTRGGRLVTGVPSTGEASEVLSRIPFGSVAFGARKRFLADWVILFGVI